MALLIDGYNLLNATGIAAGEGKGSSLHRARLALLDFLARALDPREAGHTTVVFDAQASPPGLPKRFVHQGLTVRFAARHADADSLIEELILADTSPRRLTVVSSDHRVQRAARRCGARAVDSEVWYRQMARRHRQRRQSAPDKPAPPSLPLSEEEVAYWLEQFGDGAA